MDENDLVKYKNLLLLIPDHWPKWENILNYYKQVIHSIIQIYITIDMYI